MQHRGWQYPFLRLLSFVCLLLRLQAKRVRIINHESLYENGSFAPALALEPQRFDPGAAALAHLNREGYVVIRDVANASELSHARELMWSFLEGAAVGLDRASPRSWRKARPNQYGIVWEHGVGQSRFMWFMRTRPRLLRMFELVWGTSELLTSFEGFSMMPPVEMEAEWTLAESWFHTDQNGVSRPGLQTVQSFTSLYDQDERTGAFVVVPRSHAEHAAVTRRVYEAFPQTSPSQQFLMLPTDDEAIRAPQLVRCRAGDAVLWDSRTVHCNTPRLLSDVELKVEPKETAETAETAEAEGEQAGIRAGEDQAAAAQRAAAQRAAAQRTAVGGEEAVDDAAAASPDADESAAGSKPGSAETSAVAPHPLRVAAYVAMAPRTRASVRVLSQRRRGAAHGATCTHWPFDYSCLDPPAEMGQTASDQLVEHSALHRKLIGYMSPRSRVHGGKSSSPSSPSSSSSSSSSLPSSASAQSSSSPSLSPSLSTASAGSHPAALPETGVATEAAATLTASSASLGSEARLSSGSEAGVKAEAEGASGPSESSAVEPGAADEREYGGKVSEQSLSMEKRGESRTGRKAVGSMRAQSTPGRRLPPHWVEAAAEGLQAAEAGAEESQVCQSSAPP